MKMEKCGRSGNEGLLLLASLVSIQISHQVTADQLALLAAFFTTVGDSLALLAVESAEDPSDEGECHKNTAQA